MMRNMKIPFHGQILCSHTVVDTARGPTPSHRFNAPLAFSSFLPPLPSPSLPSLPPLMALNRQRRGGERARRARYVHMLPSRAAFVALASERYHLHPRRRHLALRSICLSSQIPILDRCCFVIFFLATLAF